MDVLLQFAELLEGRLDVGFSPTAVVNEFARSITRELDYILEARNAERFAKNFPADGPVRIPAGLLALLHQPGADPGTGRGADPQQPGGRRAACRRAPGHRGGRRRLLVQADPA